MYLSLDKERSGRHLSADRLAALAPLRGANHLWKDSLPPVGCVTAAKERAKRSGQPTTSERWADCLPLVDERAQRCGSSDYAAAAEGVEDYSLQGGVGVDGNVANAVSGAETLDGVAPLRPALAVDAGGGRV